MSPVDSYVLVTAVIFDLLLGDPRWMPHPVVGVGRLISFLEERLRRVRWDGRAGGAVLLAVTAGLTYSAAFALLKGGDAVHRTVGFVVAAFISYTSLAARSLHLESKRVADALERGEMEEARLWLSRIVGRDTAGLEEPDIWRALVETVAENTSDGVIAPLFYLMMGGPPLALAYKAVNTLDSMVGYKSDRYLRFGWASARFDDLANFIPARITGLLMTLAAPLVGLSGPNALQIMFRDGRNHSSPNSGIPEAAAAGALGVRLGGTNSYFGVPVEKPTIGDARRPLSFVAYRGAVRLMYGAEGLMVGLWLAFVVKTGMF